MEIPSVATARDTAAVYAMKNVIDIILVRYQIADHAHSTLAFDWQN